MRCFKYSDFSGWAKSEKITDEDLLKALNEIQQGLVDANLGSGLYKKRLAKKGQGKRGGYRTLLAFKQGERAIFLYGFSKNQKGNVLLSEKRMLQKLAKAYLGAGERIIRQLIKNGEISEVKP